MGPLRALLEEEHDPGVRFNIVEALSGLGDKKSQRILESYANGYYLDMRLVAIPAMPKANPNTHAILRNMLKNDQPPRVRVCAAGALGKLGLGDKKCFNICIQAINMPEKMLQAGYGQSGKIRPLDISSLQRLGAISLGNLARPEAIEYLRPLLYGDDGSVRVAAAMGILKIVGQVESPHDDDELDADEQDQGPPVRLGPKLQSSGGLDE
jgi:HEAT repeat protein